ncbi:hypothetical protein MSZK_55080 [Mycobacterium sp. shizuoka-1]|nr:hypothetical protein MSZK_55080 [Mycobacterium sp. shizuoka-1]
MLRAAGVLVADPPGPADLDVYVLAEALKPEDLDALAASPGPVVAVLTKADLTGFGGAGPMAAAAARCRVFGELAGVAVHPVAGLAALAALDDTVIDDELLAALQALTSDPADLGSPDRFAAGTHRVARALRRRLLTALDLFGIAHAVLALRDGHGAAGVRAALRGASGIDGVLAAVDATAATVRYHRLIRAHVATFPTGDDAVAARMAAAVAVVRAAGMTVDDDVTAAAHLRRAITWQRYSRGPVSRLHRSCGADIARGSLRMWERAGGAVQSAGPPS